MKKTCEKNTQTILVQHDHYETYWLHNTRSEKIIQTNPQRGALRRGGRVAFSA